MVAYMCLSVCISLCACVLKDPAVCDLRNDSACISREVTSNRRPPVCCAHLMELPASWVCSGFLLPLIHRHLYIIISSWEKHNRTINAQWKTFLREQREGLITTETCLPSTATPVLLFTSRESSMKCLNVIWMFCSLLCFILWFLYAIYQLTRWFVNVYDGMFMSVQPTRALCCSQCEVLLSSSLSGCSQSYNVVFTASLIGMNRIFIIFS